MDLGLTNKSVLVAGAAGGIGQAVVATLAGEGANVFAIDRMPFEGGHAFDLAEPEAAAESVAACIQTQGSLDAIVYCVGISRPGLIA